MIVAFHAQQTVEKLIKAVLSHNQIAYPRVNDLDRLLQLLEAEQITQSQHRRLSHFIIADSVYTGRSRVALSASRRHPGLRTTPPAESAILIPT
jgi:HEPN domain-containing protein